MFMTRGGDANAGEVVGMDAIAERRFVLAQYRFAGTQPLLG